MWILTYLFNDLFSYLFNYELWLNLLLYNKCWKCPPGLFLVSRHSADWMLFLVPLVGSSLCCCSAAWSSCYEYIDNVGWREKISSPRSCSILMIPVILSVVALCDWLLIVRLPTIMYCLHLTEREWWITNWHNQSLIKPGKNLLLQQPITRPFIPRQILHNCVGCDQQMINFINKFELNLQSE